jgi:F-type H+-transporting ATPase subunit delta
MQNSTRYARPYAKAIIALAQEQQSYAKWSQMLKFLADVAQDPVAHKFLSNIAVAPAQKAAFVCAIAPEQLTEDGRNLVKILAQAKRLLILPQLQQLYETLRRQAQHEVLMHIKVARSIPEPTLQDLKSRIQGQAIVSVKQDPNLLGGGMVQIDDHVVDGSLQGKLQALREFIIH